MCRVLQLQYVTQIAAVLLMFIKLFMRFAHMLYMVLTVAVTVVALAVLIVQLSCQRLSVVSGAVSVLLYALRGVSSSH